MKEKGNRWEREAEERLNKNFPDTWKRNAGSGALGTIANIPILKGDLRGKYSFFSRRLLAECKVGYGGKSMTIQKEWFDKAAGEAEESYALPVILLKFEQSRSGVKHVICMDIAVWDEIMNELEACNEE